MKLLTEKGYICAKCPKQGSNGTECGVYTAKYFETILELFPSTTLESQKRNLSDQFHDFEFTLNDSANFRLQFKEQLKLLHEQYLEEIKSEG